MGKPAVTGASISGLKIKDSILMYGNEVVCKEGDIITIDGSSGNVYTGEIPTIPSGNDENYQIILRWADKYKRMKVFANAENIADIKKAKEMGAEGIGLCRTEHMFFAKDRINIMRQLILMPENIENRKICLANMLELQIKDFIEMFRVNISLDQTTIRLIDPPLHEFLPKQNSATFDLEVQELGYSLNLSEDDVKERLKEQTEQNPMLGFRGLLIEYIIYIDTVSLLYLYLF
jgi:pyruvate,orthophosphate dikinase